MVDLLAEAPGLERLVQVVAVEPLLSADAQQRLEVADVPVLLEVGAEQRAVEAVAGVAVLLSVLGRLEREVRVRREAPAAPERDAGVLAALFEVRGRVAGLGARLARPSLGRDRGVEQERGPADLELVLAPQLLDLDEADVAPRSDEVRDDDQGRGFGFCIARHGVATSASASPAAYAVNARRMDSRPASRARGARRPGGEGGHGVGPARVPRLRYDGARQATPARRSLAECVLTPGASRGGYDHGGKCRRLSEADAGRRGRCARRSCDGRPRSGRVWGPCSAAEATSSDVGAPPGLLLSRPARPLRRA